MRAPSWRPAKDRTPSSTVLLTTFAPVFIGELPDKTAIACLVMGTRFPWRWVFASVAAAFTIHVAIAEGAGSWEVAPVGFSVILLAEWAT